MYGGDEAANQMVGSTEHPLAKTFRSWRRRPIALPTTAAGAELGLALVFLALRLTDLVQLAVSAPNGLKNATRPDLDAALMVLYVVESVTVLTAVMRARRYVSTWWATIDTVVVLLVLLAEPAFTHAADRPTTWIAWGYPVSVGAALGAGIGFPKRWQTTVAATAIALSFLTVSLPGAGSHTRSTVITNTVAYAGFALATRTLGGYLRRMGQDADTVRKRAETLATEREFDRHRLLLHDNATILRLLSSPELDQTVAAQLRQQAAAGATQIRAFLGHRAGVDLPDAPNVKDGLVGAVLGVAAGFADLPLDLSLELAVDVTLAPEVTTAVAKAVSALLHNVRTYAHATNVVIHADTDPQQKTWELVICDNGQGFDMATTPKGFGLTTQVEANLASYDVDVALVSSIGHGTEVTLRGPLTRSTP